MVPYRTRTWDFCGEVGYGYFADSGAELAKGVRHR